VQSSQRVDHKHIPNVCLKKELEARKTGDSELH